MNAISLSSHSENLPRKTLLDCLAKKGVKFVAYYPFGYPTIEESLANVELLIQAGADVIELGVPFSDPLADGPTIQDAMFKALKQGVTCVQVIEGVQRLRENYPDIPILLMGYLNPFESLGIESLVLLARNAGVTGYIIPDLPADRNLRLRNELRASGFALPSFIAPNTSEERIEIIVHDATDFLYVLALAGTTGQNIGAHKDLANTLSLLRELTDVPLAVGFGVSTPEQAADYSKVADLVIVGSALVKAATAGPEKFSDLANNLATAIHSN